MKVKITHESVERVWQLLLYHMHEWSNNIDLDIVVQEGNQQSGQNIHVFFASVNSRTKSEYWERNE